MMMSVLLTASCLSATEYHGVVKFGGLPMPGATVTAMQGDKKVTTVTDGNGAYSFPDLADGAWNISVDMLCFEPMKQDVNVAAGIPAAEFELKMLPLDEIKKTAMPEEKLPAATAATSAVSNQPGSETAAVAAANNASAKKNAKNAPQTPANPPGGFRRADVNATGNAPAGESAPQSELFAGQSQSDLANRASDGLLVNGAQNNSASSPFALNAAFGNNRRGPRSLYNGNIGVVIDESAFDARNFSITGQDTPKPPASLYTGLFSFSGPLKIPHILKNGPTIFVNYQGTRGHNGSLGEGLMPTLAERNGDFSGVTGPLGQPIQIVNPQTGQPFQGNMIPSGSISPIARALLNFYPLPNFTGSSIYNYQIPITTNIHVDNLQARFNKGIGRKNQLNGLFAVSSSRTDQPNVFNFLDSNSQLQFHGNLAWRHSFTNRLSGTLTYDYSRSAFTGVPFFANRENISGELGITGNNQQPQNWGPPSLGFASGISGLSDGNSTTTHNQTGQVGYAMYWNRGRHNIQYGADFKRLQFNTVAQANPRGSFQFTGQTVGNDFASFLLGVPDVSSIAFGNADKYLRESVYDGYINDDWRMSPGFTLNFGLRWEYSAPITELYGRLVNLDIAPGFSAVAPVVASSPTGSLTGQRYPNSLVNPDKAGFQPRIAFSWRPLPASSLVVRAGYGMNFNTSVYQSIANMMSQQFPLSKSLSVPNTPANPLTLANGFNATPGITPDTFAIDPNFRVGYVHTWQVTIQRDLPYALIMQAQYLGIKGTRAVQEFLPNTFPTGAIEPSGFAYLTSNGNSTRESGQIQIRRRLHNGFQAQATYVYSHSIDDAALGGNNQIGNLIAQNWLNLAGERGRSVFDQRHNLQLQVQYTSGMGIGGGTLLGGWRGALLKEWTFISNITVGSGFPLTPIYGVFAAGTGFVGTIRPEYTGADVYAAPSGKSLNPAAYIQPPTGQFGNAGRDSITGPSIFTMNASMARTFRMTDRLNLDFRIDSTNPINHVTFPNWSTNILSDQFGTPGSANQMRKLSTRIILRF